MFNEVNSQIASKSSKKQLIIDLRATKSTTSTPSTVATTPIVSSSGPRSTTETPQTSSSISATTTVYLIVNSVPRLNATYYHFLLVSKLLKEFLVMLLILVKCR